MDLIVLNSNPQLLTLFCAAWDCNAIQSCCFSSLTKIYIGLSWILLLQIYGIQWNCGGLNNHKLFAWDFDNVFCGFFKQVPDRKLHLYHRGQEGCHFHQLFIAYLILLIWGNLKLKIYANLVIYRFYIGTFW